VVGDGPLLAELRLQNESESIMFTGFVVDPWERVGADDLVIFPSEFEGDGKSIVEAIIRGNPVLLRDNEDLRRFDLDDEFYFSSYDELKTKAMKYLRYGPGTFRPAKEMRSKLRDQRGIETIGDQWKNFLLGARKR
jgi:hypothetical protein